MRSQPDSDVSPSLYEDPNEIDLASASPLTSVIQSESNDKISEEQQVVFQTPDKIREESRTLLSENKNYNLTDRGTEEPDLKAQETYETKTQEDPGSVLQSTRRGF